VATLVYNPKTSSFEVNLSKEADIDKVKNESLFWRNLQFIVEKSRTSQAEFYCVTLSNLPLKSADEVCDLVTEAMDDPNKVLRVQVALTKGTDLHCGWCTVALKGNIAKMTGHARQLKIGYKEAIVNWLGAPELCLDCLEEGHSCAACLKNPASSKYRTQSIISTSVPSKSPPQLFSTVPPLPAVPSPSRPHKILRPSFRGPLLSDVDAADTLTSQK